MSGSRPGIDGTNGAAAVPEGRERGARRRKLAGYLKAANDIRQSYQQSYQERWGSQPETEEDMKGIPGAFPDVAIVSHGDEQLILFPSYAKQHVKETARPPRPGPYDRNSDSSGEAEYWAKAQQKFEDDEAVVEVDVRGWIYSPHRGPMTRKNRLLVGIARQLSGIPAPKTPSRSSSPEPSRQSLVSRHREHEAKREQEKISQEAEQILAKGEGEGNFAARGQYSEKSIDDSDIESVYGDRGRSGHHSPATDEPPGPGHLHKRASWNQPADMTQAELLAANAALMARIKPFMTNPLVSTPITIFFYDEKTSVSRTVTTNESGHFMMRAALDFIPTHVRVLASENLSATEEVKITQPKGVSIISDVDDTIKHSSISSGAREIFRNTFIRELGDLTINGVKEWYNTMYDMGVGVHYVSNSPWQLFPVLVSFFRIAGLPPGSYHLKQYSGMLQGIFEPVAERKKGTLQKIMTDFPERKFILIGDSGEADLEVYTDMVLANPGKVIAIFIRDVTTPENTFFDSAMGPLSGDRWMGRSPNPRKNSKDNRIQPLTPMITDDPSHRPALPPRTLTESKPQTSDGPAMGILIDLSDEPEEMAVHNSHSTVLPRSNSASEIETIQRKPAPGSSGRAPPPPPSKPLALRGKNANTEVPGKGCPPVPPPSRKPLHPASDPSAISNIRSSDESYLSSARQNLKSAYNALPDVRSHLPSGLGISEVQTEPEKPPSLPPRRGTAASIGSTIVKRMSWNSTDTSEDDTYRPPSTPVNKKLEMWKRRWKRAKDILDSQGVALRSWRVGEDVCIEAVQMVAKTLTEMGVEGYGKNGDGKGKGRGNEKTGEGGGEMKTKDMKR